MEPHRVLNGWLAEERETALKSLCKSTKIIIFTFRSEGITTLHVIRLMQ